jgi:L-lysine 2,3-aminomutase
MGRHSGSVRRFRAYGSRDLSRIPQLQRLRASDRLDLQAVASVLPFRVNDHVLEELISWADVPDDPIYQLTFPQPGMLAQHDLERMRTLIRERAGPARLRRAAWQVQRRLNPHPAGQMEWNVPHWHGRPLAGLQHKYRETVLVFPRQGQICHAYCTYCFRWPQFVGVDELKFAVREAEQLAQYLRGHDEVTDVLFTGGDPLVMSVSLLRRYIEPLLSARYGHLASIRIGTKALSFWPHRFLTDPDADDLLRLFAEVRRSGRQLALMAHVSHPRELEPVATIKALERIRAAGAVVRCQAPLIRHVNDDDRVWAEMWRRQVRLGAVPYYMFVARDTGPSHYFEVPLATAFRIFRRAHSRVSGLARTVRGPSMSATPGKVLVQGVAEVAGEWVFVLSFEQARDPDWVRRPFFARYDPQATWLDQLQPAFGRREFFYTPALRAMQRTNCQPAWGEQTGQRTKPAVFGQAERE